MQFDCKVPKDEEATSSWWRNTFLSHSSNCEKYPALAIRLQVIINHVTAKVEVMLVVRPGLLFICYLRWSANQAAWFQKDCLRASRGRACYSPWPCGTMGTCQDKFQYYFVSPSAIHMTDKEDSTGHTPHRSCLQRQRETHYSYSWPIIE